MESNAYTGGRHILAIVVGVASVAVLGLGVLEVDSTVLEPAVLLFHRLLGKLGLGF
jgi:hypothetical protein